MEDNIEKISYSSVESIGKHQPDKEFKPKNTTNYLPTIFDKSDKKRYIFAEGAVPLHEINTFLYDFIENYLKEGNENTTYYLSSITQTTTDQAYYHLLKLDGSSSKLNRLTNIINNIDAFYNDLEEKAFKLFLNKKNKDYRLDADIKVLKASYTQYIKEKNRIKDLIDINTIKVSKA